MSIIAKLGIDATSFESGLVQARKKVGNFAGSIKGDIAGAFAGAFTVGAIASLADEMGRVRDLSDRLGETPETIQRIGQAAKESGSDLEQVVRAMSNLTIKARTSAEAFEKVGISASAFVGMSLEEKLATLADAYEQAGNDAGKMADFQALIGNRMQDLIPFLQQGGAEMRAAFAGMPAASADAVKAIDDAGDTISRAIQQLKVWGANTLGFVSTFTEGMATMTVATVGAIESLFSQGPMAAWREFMQVGQGVGDMKAEQDRKDRDSAEQKQKSAEALAKIENDTAASKAREESNQKQIDAANALRQSRIEDGKLEKQAADEAAKLAEDNAKKKEKAEEDYVKKVIAEQDKLRDEQEANAKEAAAIDKQTADDKLAFERERMTTAQKIQSLEKEKASIADQLVSADKVQAAEARKKTQELEQQLQLLRGQKAEEEKDPYKRRREERKAAREADARESRIRAGAKDVTPTNEDFFSRATGKKSEAQIKKEAETMEKAIRQGAQQQAAAMQEKPVQMTVSTLTVSNIDSKTINVGNQ